MALINAVLGNFNTPRVKISFGCSIILHGFLFLMVWNMNNAALAKKNLIDNVKLENELEIKERIKKIIKEKEPPKPKEEEKKLEKKEDPFKKLLFEKKEPKKEDKILDMIKMKLQQEKKPEELDILKNRQDKLVKDMDQLDLKTMKKKRDELLKDLAPSINKTAKLLAIAEDHLVEKKTQLKPEEDSSLRFDDVGEKKVNLSTEKINEIMGYKSRTIRQIDNPDDIAKLEKWEAPKYSRNYGELENITGTGGLHLGKRIGGGPTGGLSSDVLTKDDRKKVEALVAVESLIEKTTGVKTKAGVPDWMKAMADGTKGKAEINIVEGAGVKKDETKKAAIDTLFKNEDTAQRKVLVKEKEKPVEIRGELKDRQILKQPPLPAYPNWAIEKSVEADVIIYFTVSPDGRVREDASVESTSGYGELDRLVRDYLLQWLFAPLAAGKNDIQTGIIIFKFRIKFQ